MNAEIISIGDEILIGETINTNASYIGNRLTQIGVKIRWVSSVGDNRNDIIQALEIAGKRADVIISTGGLGPTHDDITVNVFSEFFNSKQVLDEQVLDKIRERFLRRGFEMPAVNIGQAMIPEVATVLDNPYGTAPALRIDVNNKTFFVLPGVPFEMKNLIDTEVVPFLQQRNKNFIKIRIIHTIDIGESTLFEKIGIVDELEHIAPLAFLPKHGGVDIRITATGNSLAECNQKIEKIQRAIVERIQEFIRGFDDETTEEIIIQQLFKKKLTISLAEMFTGGNLCDRLTNFAGALKCVTHTTCIPDEKLMLKRLKIDIHDGLEQSEIVKQMAQQIRKMAGTNIGIATSFFMPRGKSSLKEKNGIVCIAVADSVKTVFREVVLFKDYLFNKQRTTQTALELLRRFLVSRSSLNNS